MHKLDPIDAASIRDDIPNFRPGDTVKVHVKVIEGERIRIQIFQGVVIARKGAGVRESFTVRKVAFGVGVERTFPVHAPTRSEERRVGKEGNSRQGGIPEKKKYAEHLRVR